MSDRLRCAVPFCRRTVARDKLPSGHDEWICAKHWPLVPHDMKRRKRLAERIARRKNSPAAWVLAGRIWERCKAAAIERAAGI